MPPRDPATVAAKWATRSSGASADYAAGIEAVQTNPLAKAADAADLWQQRVNDPATKAKFQRKLRAFSFEAWKAAATNYGQARYSSGVTAKQQQYEAAIAPVLSYMQSLLPRIHSMPKGTLEERIQRSAAFQRGMAQYQGRG